MKGTDINDYEETSRDIVEIPGIVSALTYTQRRTVILTPKEYIPGSRV